MSCSSHESRPRDEKPPGGSVGDHLLPGLDRDAGGSRRLELGVVRVDRRQGLGHGQPIGRGRGCHVPRVVAPAREMPRASIAGVYGE